MSLAGKLIGFGFRQVIGNVADDAARIAEIVEHHFSDHSQKLPKALARANNRAWQALSIALAGDGFLDKIKLFFASGDDKGIREQVRLFLQEKSIGYEGTSADFRSKCLVELNIARKKGLLATEQLSAADFARQVAHFQRYADPQPMIAGAEQVVVQIADELAGEFPNLGKLLRQRAAEGPPLLISAYAYFFRREVETDDELAHGLFFDGLRQLSASQAKSFAEVGKALNSLGDQFERVFEQLDRIETVAVETHGAVLDLQVELQRLGSLHLANADEVRHLIEEVLNRVSQAGMQKGEVKPQHNFSIRSEDERSAVKQLLARFRQLPIHQQNQVPALLNGLGKLQFGSQDFDGARQTFVAVAEEVHDVAAQAEAQFNAYRAALEEKKWDVALAAIQKAASLDSQRFAPFPMQRYQVKRILGAGGFGTAFLCHDRNFDEEVVVKTLHDATMERKMADVFREARLLRKLNHPAIIGVHECEYADPLKHVRPYIVMDYFPGRSLANHIQQGSTLSAPDLLVVARQVAQGMQAAHQQNILHRDLKPDNILVRREGSNWKVKIIDFGLALRKTTIETSMAAGAAGNTILSDSVAGTIEYAPPEQMGKLKGVKAGPYSDVYAFGKMCCYALFKTTEPRRRQWAEISDDLAEMLEKCIEQSLELRLSSFEPVLKVLETLEPSQLQRRKEEEAGRQPQELKRLQTEGESKLALLIREALDRTQGELTHDDKTAADEIWKRYRIDKERAKQIIEEVRRQWQKANPPKPQGKPGEVITNSLEMKFAWIPPGRFTMGSPKGEAEFRGDDEPDEDDEAEDNPDPDDDGEEAGDHAETQHNVTLTKGFYMGVYPVTQEQWQAVMGDNPSHFKVEHNLPVEQVSWNDCQEFIKKLTEKDNRAYRLPTEAEWEFACRAGTTTPFYFGETISTDEANYDGNFTYGNGKKGKFREKTTPVGSFPANGFGLFDMHGNVFEWCQDWFGHYTQNDVVDPRGPASGQEHVLRGGSWSDDPDFCRSAYRLGHVPGYRNRYYGFRVCFCLDEDKSKHLQESVQQQLKARHELDLEKLQQEGESKLTVFVREAFDRTQGKPTKEDTAAATNLCKQHRIDKERAKQIVEEVRGQWHKAHPPKTERKPGEIITNSLGMKFAWIPPGTFMMGSPKGEEGREFYEGADETQHKVTLTKGFFMGVHPVTQEQWQAVIGNNPSRFKGEKNLPVETVSWDECQEFICKLRETDRNPYRLPTESEWEYACRGGTITPFHFGTAITTDQANCNGNFTYGNGKKGKYREKTTPVGSFPGNAFGLSDMHGNVLEWCQDWFGKYPRNDVVDPQGPDAGQYRAIRGGSWFVGPPHCRSACRHVFEAGGRDDRGGFRLCFFMD